MIKLSELQFARAAMAPGEWWISDGNGDICAGPEGPDALCIGPVDWEPSNTTGMIHTHNAADVLIEIARAALEREKILEACDSLHRLSSEDYEARKVAANAAWERYYAAIAKVSL